MNFWHGMTTSWQFWAMLSALAAAMTAIFAKLGVKGIPPDVATFVRTLVILAFVSTLLCISGQFALVKSIPRRGVAFLILSGLATGGSWICYFRALDIGKAGQVASIDKLSVVLVAIIAFLFLHERLSLTATIGVALITIGAICVAVAD